MNTYRFHRKPDFEGNMAKVLRGERPDRATLFELFLSPKHLERMAYTACDGNVPEDYLRMTVSAMAYAGYDYASTHASQLWFKHKAMTQHPIP